jgi:hypothetical protein
MDYGCTYIIHIYRCTYCMTCTVGASLINHYFPAAAGSLGVWAGLLQTTSWMEHQLSLCRHRSDLQLFWDGNRTRALGVSLVAAVGILLHVHDALTYIPPLLRTSSTLPTTAHKYSCIWRLSPRNPTYRDCTPA